MWKHDMMVVTPLDTTITFTIVHIINENKFSKENCEDNIEVYLFCGFWLKKEFPGNPVLKRMFDEIDY